MTEKWASMPVLCFMTQGTGPSDPICRRSRSAVAASLVAHASRRAASTVVSTFGERVQDPTLGLPAIDMTVDAARLEACAT
jgi:hypothetical protein